MKLTSCRNKISVSLTELFNEGIVVTVSRQFNSIHFSLHKWEIMREALSQIYRFYSLLTIEEQGIKEGKLLRKIVWRNA